ncbi:CPBP family intramembrane glutamic endopeptidase [Planobispora longispora]|uniref:CPBP family intramembrane glutamic endopeptidase n=1 Tax=Planobispora longispora TaxID=28887 RepID=UPI00361B49EA
MTGTAGGATRETTGATLAGAVVVFAAANVLNNRVARRLAPLTSAVATGTLVAMARRSGLSWSDMGFRDGARGARIGGALAAVVAGAYTVGITIPATRRFFRDERALSLSRAQVLEQILLQVPVGTVLLEEVGFRGVLHGLLARSYGTPAATAVSSALFGLWHVLPAIDMAAANPALGALAAEADPVKPREPREPREAVPADPVTPADSPELMASAGASGANVVRVVAGSVISTGLAGVLFSELNRRGGLAAPAILHTATNSLGYVFARLAGRGREPGGDVSPDRAP